MRTLPLKPTHKNITGYHSSLSEFDKLGVKHETAVRGAFQSLLESCTALANKGNADKWKFVPEYSLTTKTGSRVTPDGAIATSFPGIVHGWWEAKDTADNLEKEITKKFQLGYPRDNILFQAPDRAILVQDGTRVLDRDLSKPENLVEILKLFFEYRQPTHDEWERAVADFKDRLPQIGREMLAIIRAEKTANKKFSEAFAAFVTLCHQALNPNLSEPAVEEMLIQHLLTERVFRKIFDVGDFMQRNIIAVEIEKVVGALTSRSFSRDKFLKQLDRFYVAIEAAADTIPNFSEKQKFLNTVYEQFFQGFAVKRADTLGIVYTPQEIVDFMLTSVEEILHAEFGRSVADAGVHIIDPFVGTGNFIVNLIRRLPKTRLEQKYRSELHCNEVMLLPYYVAAMNIEHTFYEQVRRYEPFEGICLVDTFETAEKAQTEFGFFNPENTERVKRQKAAPIFVVLGNPPYNANQLNENDNNKNRKYEIVDTHIRQTYTKDSKATLHNKLSGDPYVKAYRWASDRLGGDGVLAYVSNNSFVDDRQFDGMRKHLAEDFDALYILDLGGDVVANPKFSGTTHNVFGIKVGVSINLLVRGGKRKQRPGRIYYHGVPLDWRREQKLDFIEQSKDHRAIKWEDIRPDARYTWLSKGERAEFSKFIPVSIPPRQRTGLDPGPMLFGLYSLGVSTNRDETVYGFSEAVVTKRVARFGESYNSELARYKKKNCPKDLDNFVDYDALKWSRNLKRHLRDQNPFVFDPDHIRRCLFRPFTEKSLYLADISVDEPAHMGIIFPHAAAEKENRMIAITDVSFRSGWSVLMCNRMTDLHLCASTDAFQCFPFYVYDGDENSRRENISDATLFRFRTQFPGADISKWDIFHYVYAMMHHPEYRALYRANLRRELARIPLLGNNAKLFRGFATIGKELSDLHTGYEQAPEFPLRRIENPEMPLDWTVQKMRLSNDRSAIVYNEFLTLADIPPAAFDFRLGNRSAIEWVIDQYQVADGAPADLTDDPNRSDEPDYVVKLIERVVTVSVETVRLAQALPALA